MVADQSVRVTEPGKEELTNKERGKGFDYLVIDHLFIALYNKIKQKDNSTLRLPVRRFRGRLSSSSGGSSRERGLVLGGSIAQGIDHQVISIQVHFVGGVRKNVSNFLGSINLS